MSAADEARAEAAEAAWGTYLSEHGYATMPTSPDTGADFSAGFEAGAEWRASRPITDEQVSKAAKAAYVEYHEGNKDFDAAAAWDDMTFPADDWSQEAFDWSLVIRAALEAARGVQS